MGDSILEGFSPLKVLLIFHLFLVLSCLSGILNASQEALSACTSLRLDKSLFNDSYQLVSKSCIVLNFERQSNAQDNSTQQSFVFVTLYNVSSSPIFGPTRQSSSSHSFTEAEQALFDRRQRQLSFFCRCSACVVVFKPDWFKGNLSLDKLLERNTRCLPNLSGSGGQFRIAVGGSLLVVAKEQQHGAPYAHSMSFKYINEELCLRRPSPYHPRSTRAHWCRSVTLEQVCIADKWRCDGFSDCIGGSDEECCAPKFTRCEAWQELAGECVPHCNGVTECERGITELNCPRLPDCEPPNLACRVPSIGDAVNQGFQCLHASRRCNGLVECAGALDELGCDSTSCGPVNGTYLCESDDRGHCIREEFVCDGHEHCPNGEDERACPLISRRLNVVLCLSGLFSCASVLFVIAYFHRRYCVTSRRSRRSHRRRRFDLMTPVEQAARYFMQMCGAPPSYSQVMQMGGPEMGDSPPTAPPPPLMVSNPPGFNDLGDNGDDVAPPLRSSDREASTASLDEEESSEAEYLSTMALSGARSADNAYLEHAAEYAECSDSHIEMRTTASSDGGNSERHVSLSAGIPGESHAEQQSV